MLAVASGLAGCALVTTGPPRTTVREIDYEGTHLVCVIYENDGRRGGIDCVEVER